MLRAIDLLATSCAGAADLDEVATELTARARDLPASPGSDAWHVPARALTSLARVRADAARPLIGPAAAHLTWQVRMAAATAAGSIGDDATLEALAVDAHPNVRTTALEALGRRSNPRVFALATRALTSPDYQLVRSAAGLLRATPADQRDAVGAGVARLPGTPHGRRHRHLARSAGGDSHAPRGVAASGAAADDRPRALPWRLRSCRAGGGGARLGQGHVRRVRRRSCRCASGIRSSQSTTTLEALPRRAVITMAGGGRMELELYPEQAGVTVARFVELARAGYYNGLTFHRVVPNFVVQGGSPGANEYVGAARYMRDEVGPAPHTARRRRHFDARPRHRRRADLHRPGRRAAPRPRLHRVRQRDRRPGRRRPDPRRRADRARDHREDPEDCYEM